MRHIIITTSWIAVLFGALALAVSPDNLFRDIAVWFLFVSALLLAVALYLS